MMSKLTLKFYQGDTYQHRLTWNDSDSVPINLTGYTCRMQVRQSVAAEDVVFESSDAEGDITLGGLAGTIDLLIPTEKTSLLVLSRYVYDLELTAPDGIVTTLVYGTLNVTAEVTR